MAPAPSPASDRGGRVCGRFVSPRRRDETVQRVGAIIREQQSIKSGSGLLRRGLGGGAGMKALCYIAALTVIAAILVVSTSFTERRNVKTWAPNAVIAKPKPFETAAIVSPKPDGAIGAVKSDVENSAPAPEQAASGAEAPAATRSSTTVTDPQSTGTLPKQVEPSTQSMPPKFRQPPRTRCANGGRRHGRYASRRRARLSRKSAQRPPRPLGSRSSSGSPKEETESGFAHRAVVLRGSSCVTLLSTPCYLHRAFSRPRRSPSRRSANAHAAAKRRGPHPERTSAELS